MQRTEALVVSSFWNLCECVCMSVRERKSGSRVSVEEGSLISGLLCDGLEFSIVTWNSVVGTFATSLTP